MTRPQIDKDAMHDEQTPAWNPDGPTFGVFRQDVCGNLVESVTLPNGHALLRVDYDAIRAEARRAALLEAAEMADAMARFPEKEAAFERIAAALRARAD